MTTRAADPTSTGDHLARWRADAERRASGTAPTDPAPHRITPDELAELHATQAANRNRAYVRRRPARYADANYSALASAQDPSGLVSRWLQEGPRALLLAGPSRTGKTTAAYAVANDANQQGRWVMARTAADLSAAMKPGSDDPMAYEHATRCDLLLIDDLGRERVTDWWLEQLHRIADERCSQDRRLIVTTNTAASADAAYDELVQRYGDPVVERLIDGGGVVILDGPPVRNVKTEW